MVPKAYSYLRFSTPEQAKGDSSRRQMELAVKYASANGLELDETLNLKDLGVSGYHGRNAKAGALKVFLRAIEDGIVEPGSYLLIESFDRLSRDIAEEALGLFLRIISEGIIIVTLMDNKTYRQGVSYMDLMYSLVIMMRAHEESGTKARRLIAVWDNKRTRAKEKPMTAKIPGWLKLDKQTNRFEIIEERAEVVRRIFQMFLDGVGRQGIATALNRDGVSVFGRGKRWYDTYVAKILDNPAVVGLFIPHKLEHLDGKRTRTPMEPMVDYYPAIIDKDIFSRVRGQRDNTNSPLRGRHAGGKVNNLFGGLARCPLCGSTMTLVNKGQGNRTYLVCVKAKGGDGCKYRAVHYKEVEERFLERAGYILSDIPAGDKGLELDVELSEVEGNLDVTRDFLVELLEALERGDKSRAILERIRAHEASIEEMEKRRNELIELRAIATGRIMDRRVDLLSEALSAPEIDRNKANALMRQVFSSVEVDYEAGVLVFQWQQGGDCEIMFGSPFKDESKVAIN